MTFDVQSKVALVTGANRGIGKAITQSLFQHGASKVYAAVRNLDSAASLVEAYGDQAVPIVIDLNKPETITQAAQTATDVQLVVNNAGILQNANPLAADAIAALQSEMDINVYGLMRMAQAFAPVLKSNGGGAFVQLNSVASMKSFADFATYSASKAAAGTVNLTFVVAFVSICQGESMSVSYKYHRFPIEVIRHCVWLYHTFPLSYRDIEKMMLYRGIEVTYEAIRKWCKKFAQAYAHQIRRRRPKPADKWHLDEVVITIKGQQYYLWRAVDAEGQVLDILMQRHRDKRAAKKFFRKLLKSTGFAPRVIVTDKLRSYGAAQKELIPGVEHRQHKGLNNRAENSHKPTRVRERRMGRFKSPGHAQRFLSAFEPIRGYFHPHQHRQSAAEYREMMRQRLSDWRQFTRLSSNA